MHYNIYRKQQKQQSRDGGVTFENVIPYEYQKGAFIMSATTCSERNVNQVERWVDDTLYISPDAGISWESTGIERADSMQDAPDDVKRINGREEPEYYPITVDYNEYFCIEIPEIENLQGWQLDVYDNKEFTGSKLAIVADDHGIHYFFRADGYTGLQLNVDDDDDADYQYNVNKLIPFRCKVNVGTTYYFRFQAFDPRLPYYIDNLSVIHDYNPPHYDDVRSVPSQTRNLKTTPDYNSYYLWQKQVKAPIALTWSWAWPFEFSASTEVAVVNDKSCGYVEEDPVIYRWVDTDEIVCDEVEDEEMYAWRETGGFLCIGGNKYAVEVYSVSYTGGLTWVIVSPPEYRRGRLISTNSDDCNRTVEIFFQVSKSSLGSTFKVINELSGIESAILDGDIEIPVNNGCIETDWLEDGSTGFTLTFTIPSGYMQDELFSGIGFIQTATLRKGVTFIGDKAFYGTTLSDLDIYADAPYLGANALPNSITEIVVNQGRKQWFDSAYGWSQYSSKIVERL